MRNLLRVITKKVMLVFRLNAKARKGDSDLYRVIFRLEAAIQAISTGCYGYVINGLHDRHDLQKH